MIEAVLRPTNARVLLRTLCDALWTREGVDAKTMVEAEEEKETEEVLEERKEIMLIERMSGWEGGWVG